MTEFNIEKVLSDIESEVKVGKDGQATISGRGLARLLGVSPANFTRSEFPKKLAEKLTAKGFDPVHLFSKDSVSPAEFPDLTIPVFALYFGAQCQKPSAQAEAVLMAGSAAFYRQLFQKMKGWESEQPTQLTKLEGYKQAQQAMQELITLMEYATNKPGQQHINEFALESGGTQASLLGLITVEEVIERLGLEYTTQERRAIGTYAAMSYRSLTGKAPETVPKRWVDSKGRHQAHRVSAYPLDFLPVLENAVQLGFSS